MWEADGSATLAAGTVLTAEDLPRMFADINVAAPLPAGPLSSVLVVVISADSQEENIVASFSAGQIHSDRWSHSDGSQSSLPCP